MQVRSQFGSLGPQKCQVNAPHGFCLGIDEEIIVADTNNHRISMLDYFPNRIRNVSFEYITMVVIS